MTPRQWFPLALPLLLAACGGAPPARLYVLGDPPRPIAAVKLGRPMLRLLPVSVPDYLDTQDILLRSGQNELKPSPTGRWAERLSVGLTHALAAALTTRLPTQDVVLDRPATPPAQLLTIDVDALDINPDGRCLLTVHWTLSSGDGAHPLRGEHTTFTEQAQDNTDPALAAALTRAVNHLADQIAGGPG